MCVCVSKKKIKPSWKNQKADAPIIELGKGKRNLVVGVTGPHTLINLGRGGAVGSSAQMWGVRDLGGAGDLGALRPLWKLRAQDLRPALSWTPFPGLGDSCPGSPGTRPPLVGAGLWGPPAHPRGAAALPGPAPRRQPRPGGDFYYPPFTILTGKQI